MKRNSKNERNRYSSGITLITLILTVIIMLILAAVSIGEFNGDGIISKAIKAAFYQEMGSLEEQKEISKIITFVNEDEEKVGKEFLGRNVTTEELQNMPDTLKAEIIYVRNAFGNKEKFTTKQVWKNNMFECQDMYTNADYLEGLANDIYYITKSVSGKALTYLYDSVSDTCYKIPPTTIGKYTVHSLAYAKFIIDNINAKGIGVVDFDAEIKEASDGTLSYEPDLSNFSYATQIVYYSDDLTDEYTITIKEFIEDGKPNTKIISGQTYTFADYTSTGTKRWANIKTTANGLDSYWVWIPRYAYKLDQETQTADIIFVDINDQPLNEADNEKFADGYVVHEAFKQKDGLKGIWFSKYDPTPVESVPDDQTEPATPDLSNFNEAELKIVYYTADGSSSIEKSYTGTPAQTIEEGGTTYYWYSYINKIWANIKTTANGLDAYWVWIPRFAYKLESGTSKVILVDANNKPIDSQTYGETIPVGYKLHEAFNQQDGIMGLWFSKYDPTPAESLPVDQTEPASPNLSNFNTEELKIVYYTADGNSSIEKDYTENPAQTIEEGGTTYYWYNYTNKIWANIKTTANGLDAYWVWIPRFAYKLESGTTSVILVDTSNKPIDTKVYGTVLPEGYTLHEAFSQEYRLQGIWFSKYDPTKVEI